MTMHLTNNFNRIRDIFRGMFGAPGVDVSIDIEYHNTIHDDEDYYRHFNIWVNTDTKEKNRFEFAAEIAVNAMVLTIFDRETNDIVTTIPLWFRT